LKENVLTGLLGQDKSNLNNNCYGNYAFVFPLGLGGETALLELAAESGSSLVILEFFSSFNDPMILNASNLLTGEKVLFIFLFCYAPFLFMFF